MEENIMTEQMGHNRPGFTHLGNTQSGSQTYRGKFNIIRRPQSITLKNVFGDENRDLRPFLMQGEQIEDLAQALGISLDPSEVASEVTLGGHRIDLLVGISGAGETNPARVALELQLKPADMQHFRKVVHGAICDVSIAASVWIAPHFGAEIVRALAIAQSRLSLPLMALQMVPTTAGNGDVWLDYVRVPYPVIEAATGIVGQGGASSGAHTSAFVKTGLQPHVPLPATQLTPSQAMQAGRHRGTPSQAHDRAGEGQQGPMAHNTSKPRDRAAHDGNGSRFGEPEGLWAKLAKLLNQYDINASPQGVGRHSQPHCGVGLGRKGAKLVIQLQNRSTRLVMRIELDPAVAAILKPSFEALEEASNERFTLVANTQKRKHYQIQLSPVVMDRRASPQELERAILAFGHRVDKVRTAFRDELNRLPRESLGQEGLSATPYDLGTVHHDPFGDAGSDIDQDGQERGGDEQSDQDRTQDEAWSDEAETDEDWPG